MFAEDPSLAILDYVCIAMLLLIRNERELLCRACSPPVIEADYPVMLTHLLHYPSPTPTYPFKPALIIAQANLLRANVSPAAGIEVVLQNQELLGIKASGSEKPLIESEPSTPGFLFGRASPAQRPSSAPRPPKAKAGVQGLAQGLFERAQKAGIDKAIFSTVTDLRVSLWLCVLTGRIVCLIPLPFSPTHPAAARAHHSPPSHLRQPCLLGQYCKPSRQPAPCAPSSTPSVKWLKSD